MPEENISQPTDETKPKRKRNRKRTRKRASRAKIAKPHEPAEDKQVAFRVGLVRIRQFITAKTQTPYWELRYRDPVTRSDVRRRVQCATRDEVTAMAKHMTAEAYQGRGYLPQKDKTPTIEDAIAEALRLTNTTDETRRERARRSAVFCRWLAAKYPEVKRWDQLRPAMLQAFKVELERDGKAFDSVRLALAPIRLTWRHMVDNYPEHVRPLPRMKIKAPKNHDIECLEAEEFGALFDWLKENAPELAGMATLQALCGLRMLEAAAIRERDVDLEAGTITVTDTGHHKPKTEYSERTIPVCDEALRVLQDAIATQRIRPTSGELFTNTRGTLWERSAVSHRWTRALRQAAVELGNPRYREIPARKLRAAFATMADKLGAPDRLLKAYLGHSPGDVLGGHYRKIDLSDLNAVSEAINNWRTPTDLAPHGNVSEAPPNEITLDR